MRTLAAAAAALALLGACGSSPRKITIDTAPPNGIIVVLDEPGAPALLLAKDIDGIVKRILKLLDPFIAPETKNLLKKLDLAELVTRVVAALKLDQIPPEMVAETREKLNAIPGTVREEIFSAIGLEEFGAGAVTLKAKTARTYAIIAWAPGRKAAVESVNPFKSKHSRMTLTLVER